MAMQYNIVSPAWFWYLDLMHFDLRVCGIRSQSQISHCCAPGHRYNSIVSRSRLHQVINTSDILPSSLSVLTDIDVILENLNPILFPGLSSSIKVHSGFAFEHSQ